MAVFHERGSLFAQIDVSQLKGEVLDELVRLEEERIKNPKGFGIKVKSQLPIETVNFREALDSRS